MSWTQDVYKRQVVDLMARSAHIPVPGETIKSSLFRMGAGGKGSNQAVACKLSGGDVSVVTKVGRDAFAQVLYDQYEKIGLSAEHVFVSSQAQTGNALILVDEGTSQNAITVTPGACETFTLSLIHIYSGRRSGTYRSILPRCPSDPRQLPR